VNDYDTRATLACNEVDSAAHGSWKAGFLSNLKALGLGLRSGPLGPPSDRYPSGWPMQAPRPLDPQDWPNETFIVWADEATDPSPPASHPCAPTRS
jgi:hypothetical protein